MESVATFARRKGEVDVETEEKRLSHKIFSEREASWKYS